MIDDRNMCPVCMSRHYESICAVGGEYVSLIYTQHGSAKLNACTNCGTVYISYSDLKMLQRSFDRKVKK